MRKIKGRYLTEEEAIAYFSKTGERIAKWLHVDFKAADPGFSFSTKDGKQWFTLPTEVVEVLLCKLERDLLFSDTIRDIANADGNHDHSMNYDQIIFQAQNARKEAEDYVS